MRSLSPLHRNWRPRRASACGSATPATTCRRPPAAAKRAVLQGHSEKVGFAIRCGRCAATPRDVGGNGQRAMIAMAMVRQTRAADRRNERRGAWT